ncbi:hypothetical protein [Nisaea sp.]|uniref:alpha/beta hydrolase family esterase n=1 Tax=Nisaea sp. TaxID=2024842 RepID=UPI00329744FB
MSRIAYLFVFLISFSADASEVVPLLWQDHQRIYRLAGADMVGGARPLVVHIHGFRKRDQAIADRGSLERVGWSALEQHALGQEFLVASPAALWGQWNLAPGLRNTTLPDGRSVDDAGFIFAVVRELIQTRRADPARIYLTGISDGAIMSYGLLCHPDSPFAAAVPVIGTMTERDRDACRAPYPAPLMVIAGTNDRVLPWDGWIFRVGREISVPETLDFWRRIHSCTGQEAEMLEDRDPDDGSRVREINWTGCIAPRTVRLLRVEGGGHAVPRALRDGETRRMGRNSDIDAAEVAVNFLARFKRPTE